MSTIDVQIAQLKTTIATLEAQRTLLGDAVVNTALAPLLQQLADLEAPPPASEGERKLVTIMFADIAGFTALSEKLDPEQVRHLMNTCFDVLVPAVEKYHGTIDKFIGDAILALFGAPIAYENHAEQALRAALEMMEALADFNAENKTTLGLHFGINTGLVIAGGIGSQGQQQYSVMGDAVNLAARLEDASETGQILVGQNTYRLTAPLFEFETLPPIQVKGKAEPVAIYSLLGSKASPGTMRGIEGLRSPLVGREMEMAQLATLLKAVEAGQGHILAVKGEAGLGKSRLITEAARVFAPRATWIEGRCLAYAENISYHVAADILYSLIGANQEMSAAEVAIALRSSAERLFREQWLEAYPYLGRLLNLPLDAAAEERVKYLSAEALRARILQAYTDYVRARAAAYPLILVWEDVHWCDPSSLAVLEQLLPITQETPLLLLIVFRPEAGQAADFQQKHLGAAVTLDIQPLSDDLSIQLLNQLVHVDNLPDVVYRMILEKAEGNAFFLEEVLRSLVDAGLIIIEQDGAVAAPEINTLKALDIPDTLQGVIAARIDRLPAVHKQTLQTASVIGRMFQEQVLAYLFQHETPQALRGTLGKLREREFIRLKAEMEYIFKHAVTQDVAYGSLLITRRRELHRVTAEAIENLFPHNLDELSATLAYHYQHAEIPDKAVGYMIKAADRAKATYANAEAIRFYQTALQMVTQQPDFSAETTGRLYESLGDVLEFTGQHEPAIEAYQQGLGFTQGDSLWQARLHRKIAIIQRVQHQYAVAEPSHLLAASLLADLDADAPLEYWREFLQNQIDMIWTYYFMQQPEKMSRLVKQNEPFLSTYAATAQHSRFYVNLVLADILHHQYHLLPDETLAHAKTALAVVQDSPVLSERALPQFVLGFTHLWRHEFEQAERELLKNLEIEEQTGNITDQSRCLTYLTVIHRKRRNIPEARKYALKSLKISTAGQRREYIGMAKGNLAWAALQEGHLEEAKALGEEAIPLLQNTPQGASLAWIYRFPLLNVYLYEKNTAMALENAQAMVSSNTYIADEIKDYFQQAAQAWSQANTEAAYDALLQASRLADQFMVS